MVRQVSVTTGARLHFGPLSYRPKHGRHFGGVGMMIDTPGVRLTVRENEADRITGDSAAVERIRQFVSRIRESRPASLVPTCHIDVQAAIPPHSGLGSGTQLGLAVARGLSELAGETDVSAVTLAQCIGRGLRSAVGVYGFESGGLIVDAGQNTSDVIGALACKLTIPDDWRVLLITPPIAEDGLSGAEEEHAFNRLGSMPESLTNELSHLVLTDLLPAVTGCDFEAFSNAVYEYGSRVGQFFSNVQGGIFGSLTTDQFVRGIRELGITGVGQTSWGPTLFALTRSESHAADVVSKLQSMQTGHSSSLHIEVASPRNEGATFARS